MTDLVLDMFADTLNDINSAPTLAFTVDRLDVPCECGATAAQYAYRWRDAGRSVRVPMCRDCLDGAA